MRTVDDYENIRKAYYLERLSIRAIGKRLHHSCRLIRKALDHAQPEGYQLKQNGQEDQLLLPGCIAAQRRSSRSSAWLYAKRPLSDWILSSNFIWKKWAHFC